MSRGRPRKSMQSRKPCGRLQQKPKTEEAENVWPTPEIMARRKALLGSASETGEIECPIVILRAKLDTEQRWAAQKARGIYTRYQVAQQPPRVVVGSLRDYVQGAGVGPALVTEIADEFKANFEELRRAVLREVRYRFRGNAGQPGLTDPGAVARQAWREVQAIMQWQLPRNLTALRYGLDAIVLHYDLANAKAVDERPYRASRAA